MRRPTVATYSFVALVGLLSLGACGESASQPTEDGGPDGKTPPVRCPDGTEPTDGRCRLPSSPVDAGVDADGPETDAQVEEPSACLDAVLAPGGASGPGAVEDARGRSTVTIADRAEGVCARSFRFTSTQTPREGAPQGERAIEEKDGAPSLRTSSPLLDAAYALALEETREASVDSIRDGAFRNGAPVACPDGGCFETGKLWPYVWTRDTAYAVHLGLASVDPPRARASLLFKVSPRRAGGAPEIVQDTGSGGSWPVSTDRVVWALGAKRLLDELEGEARQAFAATTLEALSNTLDRDRRVVFDAQDGLYTGETSFLDWREQTYGPWTAIDVVPIATSKALSTNVLHLEALRLASTLAEAAGDRSRAERYRAWGEALATRIHEKLFLADEGIWAAVTGPALDGAPVERFDALGTALAVLAGIGDEASQKRAMARYPWAPAGPPVVWPQERNVAIYHNRGIWPFVTAYMALAGRAAKNSDVVARAAKSLVEQAALNMSHMENFDLASGRPWADDGPLSGPVVNSSRQIWSVAGFVGLVQHVLFGQELQGGAIRFAPFIPRATRRAYFPNASRIALTDVPFQGRTISVVVRLPADPDGGSGAYAIQRVLLDGREVRDRFLAKSELRTRSVIEIELALPAQPAEAAVRTFLPTIYAQTYAPAPPAMASVSRVGNGLRVAWTWNGDEPNAGVSHRIFRDGALVATVPGDNTSWVDTSAGETAPSHCYAVETRRQTGGAVSHRARPFCWWGPANARVTNVFAGALAREGGNVSNAYGRPHLEAWGDPGHTATVTRFVATSTGRHLVQVVGGNGAGAINTGITCSVKRVVVQDIDAGTTAGEGFLYVPHRGTWDAWLDSSFVGAELVAGRAYRIVIGHDEAASNMSAFSHFADYTGGTGGTGGPFFRMNLATVNILALTGAR
jgi:hypothetical protein